MAGERINCGSHFALEYSGQTSEVMPDKFPGVYPTIRLSHDELSEVFGTKDEPLLAMTPDANVRIERYVEEPQLSGEGLFGGFSVEKWIDQKKDRMTHFHVELPVRPLQNADGSEFLATKKATEGTEVEGIFQKGASVRVCSDRGITMEFNGLEYAYIFPKGDLAITGYENGRLDVKNDQWQQAEGKFPVKLGFTTQPYSIDRVVARWCVQAGNTEIQKELVVGIFLGSTSIPRILKRLSEVVKTDSFDEEDLRDIVSAYMYIRGEQVPKDDFSTSL